MYAVAVGTDWGVDAEVSARFELLRKLDLPGPGGWYAGRERQSGIMRWLFCETAGAGGAAAESLRRKLKGQQHPNIAELIEGQSEAASCAVFAWHGDEPLSDQGISTMPASERIRIAAQLIDALYFMQQSARPLAHGAIAPGSLWVTPSLRWCRLGGFMPGLVPASDAALAEDRQAALTVLSRLFLGDAVYSSEIHELEEIGAQWVEEHHQKWDELKHLVQRAYLEHVAVNL